MLLLILSVCEIVDLLLLVVKKLTGKTSKKWQKLFNNFTGGENEIITINMRDTNT